MKRRIERAALVSFTCLTLGACSGDEDPSHFTGGKVELIFRGQVGEREFVCGDAYMGLGKNEETAMAQDLRFYVSRLRLITEAGDEVPVHLDARDRWQTPEVALLDFEDGTGPCETNGNGPTNDRVTGSVPTGTYTGLVFSMSVPEQLNHEDPTLADAPLQVTAMQWSWLSGYKFIRAEMKPMIRDSGSGGAGGQMQLGAQMHDMGGQAHPIDRDAGHALDSQFHLGSLACFGQPGDTGHAMSCAKPNRNELRFESFNPQKQMIVADLLEMMKEVDLGVTNHCHGAPHDSCPGYFRAVGIDYDSGELIEGQTAFRVEER